MVLIEVTVPGACAQEIEPALIKCCAGTGDVFLGRQYYEEIDQWLYVVYLLHIIHLSTHVSMLSQALQHQTIMSFECVQGNLVRASAPDILAQMYTFPLSGGDSWIPAWHDPQSIFLYCDRPLLTKEQAVWFVLHGGIQWEYV